MLAPQASVGRREWLRDRSRKRNWARVDILASRCKSRHRVDKVKMMSKLCSNSLMVATQRSLGKSVGNEGLMVGKDGTQLELVAGVELGLLLAKLECMLSSGKGCMLREQLAA